MSVQSQKYSVSEFMSYLLTREKKMFFHNLQQRNICEDLNP